MTASFNRLWKPVLLTLFVVWIGFIALVNWEMRRPPEAFGQFMAKLPVPLYFVFPFETMWTHARAGTLKVGDAAPDVTLDKLDHSGKVSLATLHADTPVVLVFGSYT